MKTEYELYTYLKDGTELCRLIGLLTTGQVLVGIIYRPNNITTLEEKNISLFLSHVDTLSTIWSPVTVAVVIAFSSASKLASTGTTIVVQKDWLVVICDGDLDRLAAMNSVLRTVGLTTFILAPVAAGQLFSLAGYVWTGVAVAAWNLASVGLEYT